MRLAEAAKERKDVILLPDPKFFPPSEIASFLINNGMDKKTPVGVCENLTLGNERIVVRTLEKILKLNFEPLCVMAVRVRHKQKD